MKRTLSRSIKRAASPAAPGARYTWLALRSPCRIPARCRRESSETSASATAAASKHAGERIGGHGGPQILEPQPGRHRQPQAPLLEERVGHGGPDAPRAQAHARAKGARSRRAAQRIGAQLQEPAVAPFLQHHLQRVGFDARHARARPALEQRGAAVRERLLVRGERARKTRLRDRLPAQTGALAQTQPRVAASGAPGAPRTAARVGARPLRRGAPDGAQAPARARGERAREAERARAQAQAVAERERSGERVVELAEVAPASEPRVQPARRLQVEQPDAPLSDEQVAVVQIAVRPAGGVQARDQIADRERRAAPRARLLRQRLLQRATFDEAGRDHETAVLQLGQRERLGHRDPARVQGAERAPLAARGLEAERALPGLAQAVAASDRARRI